MLLAASTVVLRTPSWPDRLPEIRSAGIDFVELWAGFGPSSTEPATFGYTDPAEVERAGGALARAGLSVVSMHGPMFLDFPGPEDPFGAEGLEGVMESLRAAGEVLSALRGRFLVTQDAAELLGPEHPHLASPEVLSSLADSCTSHGCVFCLENGEEDERAFDRIVGLLHELRHPGLGLCLDLGHAQLWNYQDVPRAVRAAGSFLRSCHVHDNCGLSDEHLPPGCGIIPWEATFEALEDVGYRGPLVVELRVPRELGAGEFLAASAGFIDRLTGCREGAAGAGVYPATAVDRERAALSLGIGPPPSGRPICAAIAVDAFGDPKGFAEVVADGEGARLEVILDNVSESDSRLGMALLEALESDGGFPAVLRAEGRGADLLAAAGYAPEGERLFRRACAPKPNAASRRAGPGIEETRP